MNYLLHRAAAALLAVLLLVAPLAGCGPKGQQSDGESQGVSSSTGSDQAANSTPAASAADGMRQITDMAGRTLEVPQEIGQVYSADPIATVYLYTLAPDKLLGWNYKLNPMEQQYIPQQYSQLPVFGMGDSVNYEAVIQAAPQIALMATTGGPKAVEQADQLAESIGVPVVLIDSGLEQMEQAYLFLGDLLAQQEQGQQRADFIRQVLEPIAGAAVAPQDQVSVYYGNDVDSLETIPAGSVHGQALDFVHAANVAQVEAESGNRVKISLEQLLAWNPQYILVNGQAKEDISGHMAAQALLQNPDFGSLQAVQSGNVWGVPNLPFGWVDRPMGPNRVVGIGWLWHKLYPQLAENQVETMIEEFYQLFYHTTLSQEQLGEILGTAPIS